MDNIKRVIDYSGMDYYRVLELPLDTYLLMLKCSIVDELNKSNEGRDYLEKCKRLSQTTLDSQAFRNRMGVINNGKY